jgi:hypothetical protein
MCSNTTIFIAQRDKSTKIDVGARGGARSGQLYVRVRDFGEWKTPPKWQKNDLVSGGHGRAAKLGACVNWVDWLRTSADKRMWSGRRAVVMVR